jgi:hypothetical protein
VTVSSLLALEGWFMSVKKGRAMGKTGKSADGKIPAQAKRKSGLRRGRLAAAPLQSDGPPGPEQKRLVQTTFAKVEPIAEAAAGLFYNKPFELDPGLGGAVQDRHYGTGPQADGDPHLTLIGRRQ